MKCTLVVVLTLLLIPAYGFAVTIPYEAQGDVWLWDTETGEESYYSLSGAFHINPLATGIVNYGGRIYETNYAVESFQLNFGPYDVYGNGTIWITMADFFMFFDASGDLNHLEVGTEEYGAQFFLQEQYYLAFSGFEPITLPNSTLRFGSMTATLNAVPVPEPATITLLCIGLLGAITARRQKLFLRK